MELYILDLIQQIRTPLLDALVPKITALGNAGIIWIVLAAVLLIIPATRKVGLVLACALLLDLIICNGVLKPLVDRVRPCDVNQAVELLIKHPTDSSFPSGHTAASFSITFGLFFAGKKKAGVAVLVLACVISFTRLYLYVHYPTDVLGGVAVGLFCGFAGWWIAERICEKTERYREQKRKGSE